MISKNLMRRISRLSSMSYAHGRDDATAGMYPDAKEIREYSRRAARTARDALIATIEKEFKKLKENSGEHK